MTREANETVVHISRPLEETRLKQPWIADYRRDGGSTVPERSKTLIVGVANT